MPADIPRYLRRTAGAAGCHVSPKESSLEVKEKCSIFSFHSGPQPKGITGFYFLGAPCPSISSEDRRKYNFQRSKQHAVLRPDHLDRNGPDFSTFLLRQSEGARRATLRAEPILEEVA